MNGNQQQNDLITQVESSTQETAMASDDADLFDIKQRVKGMDEEAARLIQLQTEMEQQIMKSTNSPTASFGAPFASAPMSAEEKLDADARSIYVGNVDYSATAQELESHFHGCGSINRVTILCDKFSGHPKGFAYVEFGDKDSVQTAQALDDSLFKGRQIKVTPKRTNRPGISTTDRVPRGGGRGGAMMPQVTGFGFMGGRGRATGFPMQARGGFNPYMRSMRGRVVKGGRGFYHYAPY
jgi:polyadenylate-binding protein 2